MRSSFINKEDRKRALYGTVYTVILLSSGVSITYAHHSLIQGDRKGALYGTVYTVTLALIFTSFQGVEYSVSSFTISDGAFGSCFYFGTGFHGLHDVPIITCSF